MKKNKSQNQHPCMYCSDAMCKFMVLGVIVFIISTIFLGYWMVSNLDQVDTVYKSHFVRCLDDGNQDAMNTYYQDHVSKDDYCFDTKANISLCCMKYGLDESFVEEMYFESCYYGDFQKFFDEVLRPFYIT